MKKKDIINAIEHFKNKNKHKYDILKIGLFGSAARDTHSEQSDIDVVVWLKKQNLLNLIGIKQDLEEELLTPVDIISYRDTMNRFLKKRIDNEAIYI